jgi:hypothetical protein
MFKDRDVMAEYRLLEFPNETAQSWPIATRERNELAMLGRDTAAEWTKAEGTVCSRHD